MAVALCSEENGPRLKTLLVASAGGHLRQLMTLAERLDVGPSDQLATYDVPQARSLLGADGFIPVHHPTSRHLLNAAKNYRLARHVLTEDEFRRVISTGAGLAVPFMIRARQLGIPCHYIESATRVRGPSLSGRVLERVPGVHLYRQSGHWGAPRWQQGPCVFDGFTATAGTSGSLASIVVSLGTHRYPYRALVERLVTCLPTTGVEILWQLGASPDPGGLPGRVIDYLPDSELTEAIDKADVVVGHAGVGLTLTALEAGKLPVLVPRRRSRREHADDHQAQLADELFRRGLAVVTEVEDLGLDHLVQAASAAVAYSRPPDFPLVD